MENIKNRKLGRRDFIKLALASGGLAASGLLFYQQWQKYYTSTTPIQDPLAPAPAFITKIKSYSEDITSKILSGFAELGYRQAHIKGKKILLKPNYIETQAGANHINTHSMVIGATIDAFYSLGASSVIVAEGSGNCRDSFLILDDVGLVEVLHAYKVPFIDLNYSDCFTTRNTGSFSGLPIFILPNELRQVDIIVSMAKMKTHHWAGITGSLKNMFGVMPGSFYGWPKNVLHFIGIEKCILDIVTTIKPHLAIVDGIIGMEGDGPIMGKPKQVGVLVMGRNLAAVDSTCARIMGIAPERVGYLDAASSVIGPISESFIIQRGEEIDDVRSSFELCAHIPAMKQLMDI
ncbi:DUF362 domain-containing protein [Thermodesulfobacteriota bacterium]